VWLRNTALITAALLGIPATTATSTGPSHETTAPIRHVVVLFMENHSFDRILGYWCNDDPGRYP
jgi:phospholipase C